jgi:cyclase
MLRKRVIPVLLLRGESLVKTVKFNRFRYIGDPCNTVRIFNELEVDELLFLDILASNNKKEPNYELLESIADECFMPLAYGGGIKSLEQAKRIFDLGFEKVSLNTSALENPKLIEELTSVYGSQAIICSIDIRKNLFGKYKIFNNNTKINTNTDFIDWVKKVESYGAGEILLTSVDLEGTWNGLDFDLIEQVCDVISVPLISHGGIGNKQHILDAFEETDTSAVASGSSLVFQSKDMGVLVNAQNIPEIN